MAESPFWLHPAFWAAVSFAAVFLISGFWLFTRPRKWWVLLAAAIAAFVLFGLFGLAGLLAALGLKLWRESRVITPKTSRSGKKKS